MKPAIVCYETVCDVTHLEWLLRVSLAQSRYVFNLYLDFREKCYETVTLFVYYMICYILVTLVPVQQDQDKQQCSASSSAIGYQHQCGEYDSHPTTQGEHLCHKLYLTSYRTDPNAIQGEHLCHKLYLTSYRIDPNAFSKYLLCQFVFKML